MKKNKINTKINPKVNTKINSTGEGIKPENGSTK